MMLFTAWAFDKLEKKKTKKPHQFFCDSKKGIIIDTTFVYGEGNEPSNEQIAKELSKAVQPWFEDNEVSK